MRAGMRTTSDNERTRPPQGFANAICQFLGLHARRPRAGDQDRVDAGRHRVAQGADRLAKPSLGAVTFDGAADAARR